MSEYFESNLLIEDYPMMVLPKLAVAIGLNEAIFVQQLYWFAKNPANGKMIDGDRWIFNTYEEWGKIFPFWSEVTIRRIVKNLEGRGTLLTCQPEGGISRRKYYRLNRADVNLMMKGKLKVPHEIPCDQIDRMVRSKRSLPNTETTIIEEYTHDSVESRLHVLRKQTEEEIGGNTPNLLKIYHQLCVPAGFLPVTKITHELSEALDRFQDTSDDEMVEKCHSALKNASMGTLRSKKLLRVLWDSY